MPIKTPEPKAPEREPEPGPAKLDRAETKRLVWHRTLKAGQNYLDATRPAYWHPCAAVLGPGHRIEIETADHRIMFEAIVLECNPSAYPKPRVDLFFRAIMPPDLALPTAPLLAPSRWLAKQLNISGAWIVKMK